MAEQILKTRIISKHITLEQANNGTWKPYEGEIVLARVDTQKPDGHGGVTVVPTYLMKVGAKDTEGNLIAIKDLQWAHAPASDVYAWAKQQKLDITTSGSGNVISDIAATDDGITITKTEVATTESITTINGAIEALEGALAQEAKDRGDADADLQEAIDAINNSLTGTTDGTIGKRLSDVESVAAGAVSDVGTLENEFTTYKGTVSEELAKLVTKENYDAKMAELDQEDADIRADFASADDAVKTELIGVTGSTKDSNTIAGAKLYADDTANTKATAAETAAKSYADGIVATAQNTLQGNINTLSGTVTANETANATAHQTFADDIAALEAKVENVSNVMDFVGAGASLPAAESSNKGDVFVINEGDNAGKEYVFDGTTWVEFGFATANENAISQLQSDLEELTRDVSATYATKDELGAEATARGQAITDVTTAFGNADATLKNELTQDIATAKKGAYDEAVAKATELDAAQTAAITSAYEKAISDAKTAQAAIDAAQDQKITALEDEVNGKDAVKGLRTLITEEAARADAAEKANAEAIQGISKDYLKASDKTELSNATTTVANNLSTLSGTVDANKQDVDANFLKNDNGTLKVGEFVIVFDCGGVEEA